MILNKKKQSEIQCGLKMTFNDHPFFEEQKAEHKGKCLAEILALWKNSLPYNFVQVTLD